MGMPARGSSVPPFAAVFDSHGPAVLRFCIAQAGLDRGEDIFQETMIAALRAYDSLRDPAAVRSWLFSIAARKAIDSHRAAMRAPQPIGEAGEEVAAGVPGQSGPGEDGLGELWSEVAQLPGKQRVAIGLRFLADLSHREIGTVMGTSEAAARRNVFEGLRRLREDLTAAASRGVPRP